MFEVFYKDEIVERKPYSYKYTASVSETDIWHITNPDLTSHIEFRSEDPLRTLKIPPSVLAAAMLRSHEWTNQYDGRPLDHTIRIFYFTNHTNNTQQKTPLHHSPCVHTIRLIENDRYFHSSYSELYNGVFADDFDPDQDRYVEYCLPRSDKLLVLLIAHPGENYNDVHINDKHIENIKQSDHGKFFSEYDITFGEYYDAILEQTRA